MKTRYIKNKTNLKIFSVLLFPMISILMISCDSFVEVDLPESQLTKTAVFKDYNTADAAMADVYAKIRDKGILTGIQFGISNYLGNYTDELTFYGPPSNSTTEFYNNTILPSNSTVALYWNNSYNQIYAVNAILEGVHTSSFSIKEKAQLEGEALFVRGLIHFYLLQLFGDIPYIKTTDYKTNSTVARMPALLVYDNVIEDLKTSAGLLLPAYSNTERVRPNALAAKALLARVYLYKGDWENALKMATEVIQNNSLYLFENNPDKVFLKNSSETIWQFMPTVAGKNTDEGAMFFFASGPPQVVALNQSLINSFAFNDLRKTHWTTSVSNATGTWYYASKYKESKVTAASKEYSIILRLSEQYLIRSEARAEQKNFDAAKEDLNKIRNRAGLSDITANTKEDLLEAIINERRKELFTEYGHRFFDLKRTGKLDAVLSAKRGWNSTDRLLPIPESEFIVNPNLGSQNPGY
ncbi:RagB/SusD family nutrient uptake outer membrane protein [Flavobacterium sp. LHD-80]|uniref:RagB/SusD family nutrient uptake outer membrane protein n=1 Tax=Flavobacterium sp. LHD-80 TaxID=3071411 RepID=UPI0027DEFFD8|nr:RagB/SusD family nutrient uptake outer membrane protein [Flavobacterium sp. LHD-80]MDQ6472750.1 RagB/SusD family nutrient uptake outer membrane protein [Flavobacterium sp. LHD-80]